MTPGTNFNRLRAFLPLAVALLGVLGACEEPSAAEYLRRAEAHVEDGNLKAGIVELKNVLQKEAGNPGARALLGRIYLEVGQAADAEKELSKARDAGLAPAEWAEPYGRALLLKGEYQRVLEEFHVNGTSALSDDMPTLQVLRGEAHRGLSDFKAARQAFRAALAEDSDNTRAVVGLGRIAMQAGDMELAERLLRQSETISPDLPPVLSFKGDLRFRQSKFAESETAFQALSDSRPENPLYLFPLAAAEIAAGRIDEARDHTDRLLKLNRKHPRANALRAMVEYQSQNYAAAKEHSELALSVVRDDVGSRLVAGASNYALDFMEQAYNHLTVFVAEVPSHKAGRKMLGATLFKLGRADEAIVTWEPLAYEATEEDPQLLLAMGTAAIQAGRLEAGRGFLERVAALAPENSEVRTRLGQVRVALGETDEGIRDLERALDQDPNLDQGLVTLALAYLRAKEFDKALQTAHRLREMHPEKPVGATLAGLAYAGKGQLNEAVESFTEALRIRPGDPDAAANLAVLKLKNGDIQEAKSLYKKVLQHNPDHMLTLLRLSELELKLGHEDQALGRLQEAVAAHPSAPEPLIVLARFYLLTGRPEKAIEEGLPALALRPESASLLETLAKAYLMQQQYDEVLATALRYSRVSPNLAGPHALAADALMRLGRQSESRDEAVKALALDPTEHASRLVLAYQMLHSGEAKAARIELEKLKVALANDSRVAELEAAVLRKEQRLEDAIEAFERSFQLKPSSDKVVRLALFQREAGDEEASLATLRRWLEANPSDTLPRKALAEFYLTYGRLDEAKNEYAMLVELSPDNARILNNYAEVLKRTGDPGAALNYAKKALKLVPDSPEMKDTVGTILIELGELEDGLALLEQAVAALPNNPTAKFNLAQALVKAGRTEESIKLLRQVLESNQKFDNRSAALELFERLNLQ